MTTPLPPEIADRRRELRDAVRRRAGQLRRKRALIVAGPCALVLGAAVWATNLGGTPTHIDVAGRTATTDIGSTTTRASSTTTKRATRSSTTTPRSTTTVKAGTPTTHGTTPGATTPGGPVPTTVPGVTPTTSFDTSQCHNSFDPRCGFFTWQPAPAPNHGLSVSVAVSDVAPTVGEALSVTIDASDSDAVPSCVVASFAGHAVTLTDSVGHPVGCNTPPCPGPTRYGPWSPPAPSGGSRRLFGSFTASAAGTQRLVVAAGSGPGCTYLPYGSSASTGVTIAVQSAPPTT